MTHKSRKTVIEPAHEIDAPIIAGQNDAFRKDPNGSGIPGTVVFAGALANAEAEIRSAAFKLAQDFDTFTEENDPHGEHDYASFDMGGELLIFKFDYYDSASMEGHSPNKADKDQTHRVLTIMYAEDY